VVKEEEKKEQSKKNESLDEKIEENRSTRKMDRGQLSKWKKPPIDALEHLMGKKERQAGEAQKTWVKLT
jgi:hypothetical protein